MDYRLVDFRAINQRLGKRPGVRRHDCRAFHRDLPEFRPIADRQHQWRIQGFLHEHAGLPLRIDQCVWGSPRHEFGVLNVDRACHGRDYCEAGFALLEAMITIVILAFGLLGIAGLQGKVQVTNTESYQRSQAILLAQDMANRISANRSNAGSYVTGANSYIGTGDSQPSSCASLTGAQYDQCEWSSELKGATEKQGLSATGAMTGGRGCVEQIAAGSATSPAIYRVTVAWQGMLALSTPALLCGENLYGNDAYRRAIASFVSVANLKQ